MNEQSQAPENRARFNFTRAADVLVMSISGILDAKGADHIAFHLEHELAHAPVARVLLELRPSVLVMGEAQLEMLAPKHTKSIPVGYLVTEAQEQLVARHCARLHKQRIPRVCFTEPSVACAWAGTSLPRLQPTRQFLPAALDD